MYVVYPQYEWCLLGARGWQVHSPVTAAAAGITEAFVHAVLDQAALKQANALLVAFAGAHILCSLAMMRAADAAGLVLADAVNMALRIAYSLW